VFPTPEIRVLLAGGYLVITAGYLLHPGFRRSVVDLFRMGWRSHHG
jgi:hypothetical protein